MGLHVLLIIFILSKPVFFSCTGKFVWQNLYAGYWCESGFHDVYHCI